MKVKPLFKYIGGKTWLRDELRTILTHQLNSYHIKSYAEPFSGGLGSFLNVYDILKIQGIQHIVLSDINETLISTYQFIQHNPDDLIEEYLKIEKVFFNLVKELNLKIKKEDLSEAQLYFNHIKQKFNDNKQAISLEQSARLIFLQKHAFNGIYRENSKGNYNTPFNWSSQHMMDTIEIKVKELNNLFQSFNLEFKKQSCFAIQYQQDCLYYLDPPYLNSKDMIENKYHKNGFDLHAQTLLIEKIQDIPFIYSNHYSDELIKKFKNVDILTVKRKNVMTAKKENRNLEIEEMLVFSKNLYVN